MADYFAQLPNTHTLNGTTIRAIENEDGERLYLIRMEHIRQETERAMLSSMFG